MHIFVDADACPAKKEVYRVADRCRLDVTLVTSAWMRVPNERWITLQVVADKFDAADDWIIDHMQVDDIFYKRSCIFTYKWIKSYDH
ncbi:MAG: DUF188 domain-containing protein [Desulfobacula sp.]|nr:DUF188 domain-containing protein [Desulfobacula sp.]